MTTIRFLALISYCSFLSLAGHVALGSLPKDRKVNIVVISLGAVLLTFLIQFLFEVWSKRRNPSQEV